jgi:hypothetical protein
MNLIDLGIKLKHQSSGLHYIACPTCKSDRKEQNRNKPCLTVNVEENNTWWKCHNCGWSGNLKHYEKYQDVVSILN